MLQLCCSPALSAAGGHANGGDLLLHLAILLFGHRRFSRPHPCPASHDSRGVGSYCQSGRHPDDSQVSSVSSESPASSSAAAPRSQPNTHDSSNDSSNDSNSARCCQSVS
jgi:hypothetical protein